MRIAVEGCTHGELDQIYATIKDIEDQQGYKVLLLSVLRIRIRVYTFHFGLLDPGSKKSAKSMENSHKNHIRISYFI